MFREAAWAELFDPNVTPGKINTRTESFLFRAANKGSGLLAGVFTFLFLNYDGRRQDN